MLYINYSIIKKLYTKKNTVIKTYSRDVVITKALLGSIISVYNGKKYINISVNSKMLDKKLGEFSLTRKFPKHPSLDKKMKLKKAKKK